MKTSIYTFAIQGQEPQAKSIFAFDGMNKNQKQQFNKQHLVYVSKNSEGIFFTKNINDAFIFDDEFEANNIVTMLDNSTHMSNCNFSTVTLLDGVVLSDEQLAQI